MTHTSPKRGVLAALACLALLLPLGVGSTSANAAVTTPACLTGDTRVSYTGSLLSTVTSTFLDMGSASLPFGMVATADGKWLFVADQGSKAVRVYSTTTATPTLTRTFALPASPFGLTLSPNGTYLLASGGTGAFVVNVAKLISGGSALVGTLRSTSYTLDPNMTAPQPIDVRMSADGKVVFVALEYAHQVSVFNFARAVASGFATSGFVGAIPTGGHPVGIAVGPNQKLFVTSQADTGVPTGHGSVRVVDAAKAATAPASSVTATVDAGCGPVRAVYDRAGGKLWVSARASNAVLAFSAATLSTAPNSALVGWTRVGQAPVGLYPTPDGSRIVVADSNRFDVLGGSTDVLFINASKVVGANASAVVGHVAAQTFPREVLVSASGSTAYVTNYGSHTLQIVDLRQLP